MTTFPPTPKIKEITSIGEITIIWNQSIITFFEDPKLIIGTQVN